MSRYTRNHAGPLDLPGITESLASPGLQPLTAAAPVSPAQELGTALGVLGDAGAALERYGHEQQRLEEKHAEYWRGEAATASAEAMPLLQSQIEKGEVAVPLTTAELPGWAEKLVGDRLPPGVPDTYAKEFRDRATHATVALGAAYQTQKYDENRKAAVTSILNGVTGVTDQGRLGAAADEIASQWKINPQVARGKVAQAAMAYAADTGNADAMTAARTFAGGDFKTEQALAQAAFDQKRAHNEAQAVSDFKDVLSGMFLNGESFDAVREQAKSMRGIVPDAAIEAEVRAADAREYQANERAMKATVAAYRTEVETAHAADADAKVRSGRASQIEEHRYTTPDGATHTINRAQAESDAMDREFRRIGASSLSPEAKDDAMVRTASDNGYVVPAWKREMEAGTIASTESAFTTPGSPPPPTTLAGFARYKNLKAKSPELLAATVDERTARFYDLALAIQQDTHVGTDDTQALLAARGTLSSGAVVSDKINGQIMDAATSIVKQGWNTNNAGAVAGMVANLAKTYAAGGVSVDKAVSHAKDIVSARVVDVNKWSVDVSQANVPADVRPHLGELAGTFVKVWADQHAAEDGYSPGDLTVRFNRANGFWTIVDGDTGITVPDHGDPSSIVTTTGVLVNHYELAREQKDAAAREKAWRDQYHPFPMDHPERK